MYCTCICYFQIPYCGYHFSFDLKTSEFQTNHSLTFGFYSFLEYVLDLCNTIFKNYEKLPLDQDVFVVFLMNLYNMQSSPVC